MGKTYVHVSCNNFVQNISRQRTFLFEGRINERNEVYVSLSAAKLSKLLSKLASSNLDHDNLLSLAPACKLVAIRVFGVTNYRLTFRDSTVFT